MAYCKSIRASLIPELRFSVRSSPGCSCVQQVPKKASQRGVPVASSSDEAAGTSTANRAATTRDKLALLQQLKQRSTNALLEVPGYVPTSPKPGARVIDERMYQASMETRKKLSEKLSEANMYASFLEQRLGECHEDLEIAHEYMQKVCMEFGTTSRLAEAAAAAVRFGVDKEEGVEKLLKLCDRLTQLEQAVHASRDKFRVRVPQRVPVTWVGIASEVRLVGDFDGWTRGLELSASEIDFDSSLRSFEAVVPLLPGKYRVKFLVDGEWRLAPDWPMEQDDIGETNNVLVVA